MRPRRGGDAKHRNRRRRPVVRAGRHDEERDLAGEDARRCREDEPRFGKMRLRKPHRIGRDARRRAAVGEPRRRERRERNAEDVPARLRYVRHLPAAPVHDPHARETRRVREDVRVEEERGETGRTVRHRPREAELGGVERGTRSDRGDGRDHRRGARGRPALAPPSLGRRQSAALDRVARRLEVVARRRLAGRAEAGHERRAPSTLEVDPGERREDRRDLSNLERWVVAVLDDELHLRLRRHGDRDREGIRVEAVARGAAERGGAERHGRELTPGEPELRHGGSAQDVLGVGYELERLDRKARAGQPDSIARPAALSRAPLERYRDAELRRRRARTGSPRANGPRKRNAAAPRVIPRDAQVAELGRRKRDPRAREPLLGEVEERPLRGEEGPTAPVAAPFEAQALQVRRRQTRDIEAVDELRRAQVRLEAAGGGAPILIPRLRRRDRQDTRARPRRLRARRPDQEIRRLGAVRREEPQV